MNAPIDPAASRRTVYALFVTLAVGMAAGRVASAVRVYEPDLHRPSGVSRSVDPRSTWPATRPEPMPTYSSNDRSRWAAVRALVDEGTWVIGRRDRGVVLASPAAALAARDPAGLAALLDAGYRLRVASDRGIVTEDGWQTVDKVLDPTELTYHSTKPPLLTALAAGEYWLLKKAFGWSIVAERFAVVRTIVFTLNVVPLAVYLWLFALLLERFGATDWGRLYVLAAAAFGTLLTPFLVSLNNHTLATCSAVVALYATVRLWRPPHPRPLSPKGRGEEEWSGVREPSSSPLPSGGVPAAPGSGVRGPSSSPLPSGGEGSGVRGQAAHPGLYVVAGFFAGFTACNELPALAFAGGLFLLLLWRAPGRTLAWFVPAAAVPVAALLLLNYAELGRLRPAYAEFGGPWYTYEGSHWRPIPGQIKPGIDSAGLRETKGQYAFHLLLGHHGWFSLTPVYFLALAGMGLGLGLLLRRGGRAGPGRTWAGLAAATFILSVVVIGFYLVKSDNYGGWSNGPRWLMWLAPLWLLAVVPVADWLGQRRWGRALALVLLALSVLSAHYSDWNPWRHPWLYRLLEDQGWIRY